MFHEHPHNGVSESLSLAAVKPLRKLLTWCFLHLLVASDLPVELPTLFLWALSTSSSSSSSSFANSSENTDGVDNTSLELPMSFGYAAPRNNPAVAKISLLRCLHLYLGSPVEEACANLLQHRGVLWSSYGCPRMPTPHTRRTDRCYEQHMYDCAARAEEFLREEEENDEDGVAPGGQHKGRTPESVREAFALQCRWSRISAVVSRGNLVLLLASHVECAVDAALALVPATAATRNQSSGSHCILQSLGTLSLDLLLTMVRQGDEDVLAVVHRAFLLRTWRLFVSLVDASGGSSSALADEPQPGGAVAAVLRRQWLRVLAVMVRRSRATANFFFQANGEWSSSALLLVIVRRLQYVPDCGSINTCRFTVGHTDDDAVDDEEVCLALRLLSAGLVYGWGLRSVAELLLADQVAVAAVCKGKDKGPSEAGRSLCRDGGAPLFTLLEQAAIACSNILSSGHSGGEVSSQEEATQTSSCLLAFVRGNWAWMENKMLTGVSYPLRSAILAFLCAVFPNTTTTSSTFAPGNNKLPETSHKVAMAEMASEITAVDLASVRGRGTLSSVWDYTEQLVRTAEQHQGGVGSVTATALHLRGQSQELLHFAASQTSFDLRVLGAHIQVLALARAGTGAGVRERATCGRMERCELAFQLQRFVCAVAHVQMQQQTGPSNTDSSIRLISDCSELMNACCAIMETPFRLHLPKTSTSPALEVPPAVAPDLERGAVSAGLLMWHVQRIQQAGLVLLARFAASAFHLLGQDSSNSITTTAAQSVGDALVCLLSTHLVSVNAHSLSGALEVLFGAFLTYNLRICSADDQGGAVEVVAPVALSADIFLKVLGVPLQHATSSSSSAASSSSSALTGRFPLKSATEWLDLRSSVKATETGEGKASESAAAEAKVLSLQPGWAFRVLGGDLADSSFAAWLRVLDSLSSSRSAAAAAPSQDSNNQYLAEQLYHLMKLSTSDQAHKWFKTAAVGGYSDSVEFGYHLPGCHPSAVSAYRRLICRILLQAVGRSHTSFAVEFCSVVSKDFYNTTGLVSKFLKKGKASSSWRESLDGLLDLCDKAVDAALNQAVDPEVHSIVLTVLASPCVPWAVRQRVWSALSAVRLVHLLEDQECIQGLLPTLLLRPQQVIPRGVQSGRSAMCAESLALYTEVIDALTQLRATSDRTWSIVAVSVFQMARYLFVDAQEGSEDIKAVVTGQAAHLLAGLVKVAASKQVQGCWLLQAVLDMAAKVPQHAPATAAVVGAASDECSGVLEDLLATCAQSSTCNSISNVLIPERLCQLAVEYPSAVGNCTLAQIFLLLQ